MTNQTPVVANDRTYATPKTTAIAICLDGCEPAYLDEAIAAGLMPNLERIKATGTVRLAHSVIPSFTNPNNLSIATGRPPSVHGICGNYLYDPDTKEEVMMNDVRFLRAPTIFQKFYNAGSKVAIVTAKDKLRALLGAGLKFDEDRAICFSAERSDISTVAEHGIDNGSEWLGMAVPEVYSAELSEFVFAAGVKLLAEWKPDVMYLTTTDFVQHKYAPGIKEANDFYEMFDKYLGQLDEMGAAIVITGDHGMKPKHHADGSPSVIYIQDVLDEWLPPTSSRSHHPDGPEVDHALTFKMDQLMGADQFVGAASQAEFFLMLYGANRTVVGCFNIPYKWRNRCKNVWVKSLSGGLLCRQYSVATVKFLEGFLGFVEIQDSHLA